MGLVRYRSFICDSARWEGFAHRDDDIVISTPPKSGTTWMQMLVALVLFDGNDFPAPLNEMSPWLDMNLQSLEQTQTQLAAQEHRRFMKTHTPLDGVPMDDRVSYIVVGRDPRDVWVSFAHHLNNLRFDRAMDRRAAAVGVADLAEIEEVDWPEDPVERYRFQIDLDAGTHAADAHLASVLHHLGTGWQRRQQPNVHLFHYSDMKRDLAGQIVRLGDALGIEVAAERARELAAEAAIDRMRDNAGANVPDGQELWQDATQFFRSGGSGEWRSLLGPGVEEHYASRVAELVEPDLAHWSHHGWLAL